MANAEAIIKLAKAEGVADVNAAESDLARAKTGVKSAELNASVEEELWKSKAATSDVKFRLARQALDVAKADRDTTAAKLAKAKTGGGGAGETGRTGA